jgi:hypothetical protein
MMLDLLLPAVLAVAVILFAAAAFVGVLLGLGTRR